MAVVNVRAEKYAHSKIDKRTKKKRLTSNRIRISTRSRINWWPNARAHIPIEERTMANPDAKMWWTIRW